MNKILVVLLALFVAMPVTAGAALIKFDTTPPQGDPVSDFYKISDGVFFTVGASGNLPIATTADWRTFVLDPDYPEDQTVLQAVAADSGLADFNINFVNPAQNVSFYSGYWQFEPSGNVIGYYQGSPIIPIVTYPLTGTFAGPLTGAFAGIINYSFAGLVDTVYFDGSTFGDPPASITHLSFEIAAAPIPEPGTMLLLGSGLLGLVPYCRKRRKRKKHAGSC